MSIEYYVVINSMETRKGKEIQSESVCNCVLF